MAAISICWWNGREDSLQRPPRVAAKSVSRAQNLSCQRPMGQLGTQQRPRERAAQTRDPQGPKPQNRELTRVSGPRVKPELQQEAAPGPKGTARPIHGGNCSFCGPVPVRTCLPTGAPGTQRAGFTLQPGASGRFFLSLCLHRPAGKTYSGVMCGHFHWSWGLLAWPQVCGSYCDSIALNLC